MYLVVKLYKVYAEADGSVKYYQDIESIKPAFFETLRAAKSYALDLAKYVESDYQTIKPNQSDFQYCILDERKKRSQSRMHSGITNPKDYLVVTDCNKKEAYHLPVYIDGIPNRKLMGNAWAALHSNFRGQSYKGPQRQEAILALKKIVSKFKHSNTRTEEKVMMREALGSEIIRVASHFVNLYETKSNAEWRFILDPSKGKTESEELLRVMKACGWQTGWSYCCSFVEAIWRTSYVNLHAPQSVVDGIAGKLTPSVMTSYNNYKTIVTKEPIPGSIFFMRKGKSAFGHAGIVVGSNGTEIATIEGNTSAGKAISDEADRNGDGIFKKQRPLSFKESTGLYLLGFLAPIVW